MKSMSWVRQDECGNACVLYRLGIRKEKSNFFEQVVAQTNDGRAGSWGLHTYGLCSRHHAGTSAAGSGERTGLAVDRNPRVMVAQAGRLWTPAADDANAGIDALGFRAIEHEQFGADVRHIRASGDHGGVDASGAVELPGRLEELKKLFHRIQLAGFGNDSDQRVLLKS